MCFVCYFATFLGGGEFKYFWNFHLETWGRFPNLTNIFQMGWNHQPVLFVAVFFQRFGLFLLLFFCGFSAAFASTSSSSSSSSSSSFSSSSHPYFHLHLIIILIFIHVTTIKNDNKSRTATTPGFRCFQDLPFPRSTHDQRHGKRVEVAVWWIQNVPLKTSWITIILKPFLGDVWSPQKGTYKHSNPYDCTSSFSNHQVFLLNKLMAWFSLEIPKMA